MDVFGGRVWASHSNCRELVPDDRQFSDEQLKLLVERGAVVGGAPSSRSSAKDSVQRSSARREMVFSVAILNR